ncbi:MAG: hypothetical protein CO128_03815 [Ignavibacteriales bacterium CG_4_9_14_3_um_filter_30_11]|nr:MAG: hypothetical protein CO128_03815 [Ignavibacteriales bacterium CG_4_9_14_3_um_filter_30_11]
MKSTILSFFIAVGLFFAGCSDQASINGPTNQDLQPSSNLIGLGTNGLQKAITISKTINGDVGGQIDIVGSFGSGLGAIQVNGTLTVPAGAYSGDQTISVNMNGHYAVVDFGPSPFTFDIPLNFSMEITNVILSGNISAIHFIYIADDGTTAPVELQGETVANKEGRTLSVTGAQLPHFSRYGWAK